MIKSDLAMLKILAQTMLFLLAPFFLGACNSGPKEAHKTPLSQVTVMEVDQSDTPIYTNLVGFVKPYKQVELRSQVSGILENVDFKEGQRIKKGQRLFVIDPKPLMAALDNAKANLASAQANLIRAEQDVVRYKPLLADNAIPRQTYDLSVMQEKQGQASVAAAQAALDLAKLDLGYSSITAPVNGQIGLKAIDVGSYVAAGQTVLATVTTLDPVYVYFSVAETSVLKFNADRESEIKAGRPDPVKQPVQFILSNGQIYQYSGKIDFSNPTIDPETGTLTLRAVFPNPQNLLQTGMTGRVRVKAESLPNAMLVPQCAVTELLGRYFLIVLDKNNKAEERPVDVGETSGDMWIIKSGVKPGDRVVVDGLQKAHAGQQVKPVMMRVKQLESSNEFPEVTTH